MVQKAYVTSTGEPTADLCVWSLKRNGFDVEVLQNDSSLAVKLAYIYAHASDNFLRVDADIIVNRNMTPEFLATLDKDIWWWQFVVYDWYKQDTGHSMAYISKKALPALRGNINSVLDSLRPETEMSRIAEFYSPRRMETYTDTLMGLHGFGITDIKPVKALKTARGQIGNYDFELHERLGAL